MRILHLYKDYAPVVGGIENHIQLLAEAQAARGHAVTVLVTSRDRRTRVERLNGVRVIFAARLADLSSAPLSLEFVRILARERPDVAHLHFPYPPAEIANHFFGHAHKTVLTYHSDIVRQKYWRAAYTPLLHHVLARVDSIIATSLNYIATSSVLTRWEHKCVVVPLGIDPTAFALPPTSEYPQPNDARAGIFTRRQPLPRTTREGQRAGGLLFVGRLRYYKGLNYLLEALPQIPAARLVVVGTGPMEGEWKNLAQSFGVAERVDFVGEVARAELPAYYAACDVFVLPASERSEAFGAVQLEAMAAGKPVVSCDVGTGVAWVNQNEVTGLVVPPRDPNALATAINRLLQDEALRERMGVAGRSRVREEFTAEKMVERVMEVYVR